MIKLFFDSDCDITPAVAAEYGAGLISMPYSIDAKTVYPYEDWKDFESHEFYDMLRSGVIPTTSAITKERYIEYFEPWFQKGCDILYVHFSREMSATFNGMDQAVAELKAKYPGVRFETIDTKGITTLGYVFDREVGDRVKAGMSLDDVLEWARGEVDHYAIYFFADDLKFFRRSGRVSGLAATMGTLIGIRPIIYMNDAGKMLAFGKAKGRANAMQFLVDKVVELGDEIGSHRIAIGHTDSPAIAAQVRDMIRERCGKDLDIEIVVVNPTAGSHSGPDGVAVSFHAKSKE